ncbi:MAG: hypothetical protein IPK83_22685 [Planctomycetes bacterium]|nr:hypothetical protein [Planctomycetota bacterium]
MCALSGAANGLLAAEDPNLLSATVLIDFESDATLAMHMPTDVAIGPDETVYVADGVSDRIVTFDTTGRATGEIRKVGEYPLSRPVGLDVDRQGRLWIADTGNSRIVFREADGNGGRAIALPAGISVQACDPTDIAIFARRHIGLGCGQRWSSAASD